jgi:hypothetical protein
MVIDKRTIGLFTAGCLLYDSASYLFTGHTVGPWITSLSLAAYLIYSEMFS